MRTVRAKLLSLGALSIVVILVTLPLLMWLLHAQMLAEISEKAANAGRAYQVQLDDDVTDVRLAVAVFAHSSSVQQAISTGDTNTIGAMMNAYATMYPDIDIALYDRAGGLLARTGCDEGGPPLGDAAFVARALAEKQAVTLSDRGCDRASVPTYVIAERVADVGVVVVGLDFSAPSLARAAKRLGVELALVGSGGIIDHTAGFPVSGDPSFIQHTFTPRQLAETHSDLGLIAAIDTAPMRSVLRRTAVEIGLCIALAAALAAGFGLRTANVMSNAIGRLSGAFGRLRAQDYGKMAAVTTGDELEDLSLAFNQAVDVLRERDKLKTTFGKYMTEAVVEHLLAGKVPFGGEALTVTIVFSDIRSFTSISEKMEAKALVALLNEYFTEMVDAITHEQGVVDKYIGDAVMAVFGAPVSKPDDALRAVRSAIGMRQALARLNERLVTRGIKPISTGIGIHTGEVIAGNIGSERRMEYTVIGDAVNVALRLENATKELGAPILLSEDTYALVKGQIEAEQVRAVTVKGRPQAVMAYAVRP